MRPYGLRFRQREKAPRGAPPSLGPLCEGGSARRRWGREPCGGQEYFGLRLSKNICRGEHCSPVPACLTRKLSRKKRCGGKLTGDQWSPLHTQQGKTCPSPPVPACGKGKLPRAHIECAPTDYVFDQREKTPRGAPPSLGPLCEGAPPAGGGGENRAAGRNISGLDCQKTFVGASIARPCPLALQENCPGKSVAAVS